YDITEEWSRQTRIPLRTIYSAPFDDELPSTGDVRLLQAVDGGVIGRVFVDRPSGEQLIQDVRNRYDDVVGFWVVLLCGWLVAGAYGWYRRALTDVHVRHLILRFSMTLTGLIGFRFVLLAFDLPNRLQRGKSPLAPLYDPSHLASTLFGGSLRSIGDVILTAAFVVLVGMLFYQFVVAVLGRLQPAREASRTLRSRVYSLVATLGSVALLTGMVALLTRLTNQVIQDSTLDYFARTGLLPENLVLIVFVSLLLFAVGTVITFAAGMVSALVGFRFFVEGRTGAIARTVIIGFLAVVVFVMVGWAADLFIVESILIVPLVVALLSGAGFLIFRWYQVGVRAMTLRNILLAIFWVTAIVYPLLYNGLDRQRQNRLTDAVESFDDGRDPRVLFAIDRILLEAQSNPALLSVLEALPDSRPESGGSAASAQQRIGATRSLADDDRTRPEARRLGDAASSSAIADSIATSILRQSLLASMGNYEVSLTIFDSGDQPIGRYYEADQRLTRSALAELERTDFQIIREMHAASGVDGPLVEPMTGRRERERFRYQGLTPVTDSGRVIGWIMASAEPRSIVEEAVTPFPRVLVPSGFYGNLQGDVSLAEFRDGVLVRNTGSGFVRYRLSETAQDELATSSYVRRKEVDRGRQYDTYYDRQIENENVTIGVRDDVVIASRLPAVTTFDHLYYLLRLTVSGLFLGIPIYLIGLFKRRAAGLLPAPVVRFRDKVLNAFFAVGLTTVAAMGFVGLQVVTGENERAIESWLKQHLERVEKTLFLDAQAGELAYSVMDRTSIDSLAARVGLDLNLYRGTELVASSRPQLVEDRLIDRRLPMLAYKALFFDGFRFAATDEHVGEFAYTAGFRALTDEEGRPYYVVSVPTLPEQERIEEERARTVAYLFGALLLLVVVVMVTASILANALTRPIARLREGLEAVSRGQFSQIRPFESRDEFGELVETFNTMQDQLADSRRQVAQQERQLAWREMARQVAHEIKNPLTPMKLSIQHLRRSFDATEDRDSKDFKGLFSRITTTLVEQIDALARIANEFSTFARMPQRMLEELDLNAVVSEAAALMEVEEGTSIKLGLVDKPLIVQADREELRRIFINLIKNGIQSVPEDRQVRIEIISRSEPP
ncbi:MAG: HAMP domain-containing protein, partial [Rhodothermales bacterium]|nr:HAMP domain-containing protein [Rhodothermales bacterium]